METLTGRMTSSENAVAPANKDCVAKPKEDCLLFKMLSTIFLGGWREIRGLIESTQALLNTVRGARELPASACYNGQIYVFIATAVILYLPSSLIPVLNGRERPFLMK